MKQPKTETRRDAVAGPRGTALARAVALLSRREHSALELRSKLLQRGFEETEVDAALARLAANGLQDDTRFAEAWVRSRANSGQGPRKLQIELSQHGLEPDQARQALQRAEAEADWDQRALELAQRRYPDGVCDPGQRRRLADLLLRRGYSFEVMRTVLEQLERARADEPSDFD